MQTFLTAAIVLFLAGTAAAADYYVYRNGGGRMVLSNIAPPGSAEVVAKHALTEATAEEITATAKANQETQNLNLASDLVNSRVRLELAYSELIDSWRRRVDENVIGVPPVPFVQEWNQVAVSVGDNRLRRGFAPARPMPR
jgi:Domain of unknown function (DUF4124)